MDPNFDQARTFFVEGLAHYQAGRFDQAEKQFAASLALLPGRTSTLTNLGATRLKLGKFQEAADLLSEALAQEPDNVEALGHRASALAELGHTAQALACIDRVVEAAPALGAAWSLRGSLLRELWQPHEAARSYEKAIACGCEPELNRYYLAALNGREVPGTAPPQYVESLFDGYVDGFEEHLVQVLNYRAPEILVDSLRESGRRFKRALDLGCGTGLCGLLLRPLTAVLEGVDLSGNMVRRARARQVYDQVAQEDLVHFLLHTPERYDLVLAADVFIYVGALEAVFRGVARVMELGGVFCFSVEAADEGQDLILRPSLRYAHSLAYIEKLAQRHGFQITTTAEGILREDQRVPIRGWFAWLKRS